MTDNRDYQRGLLCRDADGEIVFFYRETPRPLRDFIACDEGRWLRIDAKGTTLSLFPEWPSAEAFYEEYDLSYEDGSPCSLPRSGKSSEIYLEL